MQTSTGHNKASSHSYSPASSSSSSLLCSSSPFSSSSTPSLRFFFINTLGVLIHSNKSSIYPYTCSLAFSNLFSRCQKTSHHHHCRPGTRVSGTIHMSSSSSSNSNKNNENTLDSGQKNLNNSTDSNITGSNTDDITQDGSLCSSNSTRSSTNSSRSSSSSDTSGHNINTSSDSPTVYSNLDPMQLSYPLIDPTRQIDPRLQKRRSTTSSQEQHNTRYPPYNSSKRRNNQMDHQTQELLIKMFQDTDSTAASILVANPETQMTNIAYQAKAQAQAQAQDESQDESQDQDPTQDQHYDPPDTDSTYLEAPIQMYPTLLTLPLPRRIKQAEKSSHKVQNNQTQQQQSQLQSQLQSQSEPQAQSQSKLQSQPQTHSQSRSATHHDHMVPLPPSFQSSDQMQDLLTRVYNTNNQSQHQTNDIETTTPYQTDPATSDNTNTSESSNIPAPVQSRVNFGTSSAQTSPESAPSSREDEKHEDYTHWLPPNLQFPTSRLLIDSTSDNSGTRKKLRKSFRNYYNNTLLDFDKGNSIHDLIHWLPANAKMQYAQLQQQSQQQFKRLHSTIVAVSTASSTTTAAVPTSITNTTNTDAQIEAQLQLQIQPYVTQRRFNLLKIQDLLIIGNFDHAITYFKQTMLQPPGYSTFQFNALLSIVVKASTVPVHVAEDLFDFYAAHALDHQPLDIASYAIMIFMYTKTLQVDQAVKTFKSLISKGMKPNSYIFSSLIKLFGRTGQIERSKALFNRLPDYGHEPDTILYNTLIKALCINGLLNEASALFNKMKNDKIPLSDFTYTILIHAMGHHGHVDKAVELFGEMKSKNIRPSRACYSALIDAHGKANQIELSLSVFQEMKYNNVVPDLYTYNTLIDICGRNGAIKVAFFIYREMFHSNIIPDRVTFNSLINACGRCKHLEKAFIVLQEMYDLYKLKPDLYTYNMILSACIKSNRLDLALKLFKQMHNIDLQPDSITYNILINGCGSEKELGLVLELTAHAYKQHIEFDTILYNTIISNCFRCKSPDDAIHFFERMKDARISANVVTYNILIDGYGRICSNLKQGWNFYQLMKQANVKPNIATLGSLAKACKENEDGRLALLIIHEIEEYNVDWTGVLASNLCHALAKSGYLENVMELKKYMGKLQVKIADYAIAAYVDALVSQGLLDEARAVVQEAEPRVLTLVHRKTVKVLKKKST